MLQQAVQRIDHLAMIVHPENLEKYIKKLSELLDITFDEPIRSEDAGVMAALSWDSGLELVAPLRQEGRYWDKLQKHGEGATVLIFGVPDMDAAKKRAASLGVEFHEWKFGRDMPWLRRFASFRETKLEAFPDGDFAMEITLSEIIPRTEEEAARAMPEDCLLVD